MLNRSTIAGREGGAGKSGSSPPSATTMPTNRRKRRPRNRPFSSRQIADWARPQRRLSSRCVQPRTSRRRLTMAPTISQPTWISGCRSRRESMLHGMRQTYRPTLITPLRVTSPVLTAMPQSGIKRRCLSVWGPREWTSGCAPEAASRGRRRGATWGVHRVDAAEWHHAPRGPPDDGKSGHHEHLGVARARARARARGAGDLFQQGVRAEGQEVGEVIVQHEAVQQVDRLGESADSAARRSGLLFVADGRIVLGGEDAARPP